MFTDPSGHSWFSKLWKKIKKHLRTIVAIVVAAVIAIYLPGLLLGPNMFSSMVASSGALTLSAAGVATVGAAAGFASGLIMTGSLSGALKGAAWGAVSGLVAFGIGEGLGHAGGILSKGVSSGQAFIKAAAHGLSRGIISMAQGGTFKSGFASGFTSSFFSPGTTGKGGFFGRTSIAAIVGGTASKIGGGKFSNGAVSGAFVHMFNAEVTKVVNEFRRSPKWKYIDRIKEGAKAVAIKAKYLRVELKTFGGGLDTYKVLITKTWDYPALSGETVVKFYGSQIDTVVYEIQMENGAVPTWHINIPRLSDDMASKFIGGVGRMRYGDVYAY